MTKGASPIGRLAGGGCVLGVAACLLVGCSDTMAWLAGEAPEDEAVRMPGAQHGMVGHGEWRGQISRAQGTTYLVARSQQEWQALWDLAGRPVPAPLPERYMALGVFLGVRTASNMGVEIVDLRLEHREGVRDHLLVDYREVTQPGPAVSAYEMSSPYVIMLMDVADTPVRFIRVP